MSGLTLRWGGLAAGLVVLVAFPLVITDVLYTQFGVLTLIFIASVIAWNMFSGYSGYISLGHAVFFGTGAYAVGLLTEHWHLNGSQIFLLLPLGGVAGAAMAVPFGLIALQVRRHTFVVITIAVFFIFQLMAYNFSFTGGNNGLSTPTFIWSPGTYNNPFYYAALIIAVAAGVLSWLVRGSRFGLQLLAIRDDEDRARGLGVRAMRVKLSAFMLSAAITGVVGGLWWFFIGQALPETVFNPVFDLSIALMAFLGGFGTLTGPILGALILEPLQQYVSITFTNGYIGEIVLGALFLLVILFLPRGLVPTVTERITAWRTRGDRPAHPSPAVRAADTSRLAQPPPAGTVGGAPGTGTPSTGSLR